MDSIPSDAIPELQRLGERLRLAREQQGLSRQELADRLHLGSEQLMALECADAGRLHELVFVIAQARRLATALNLSIEAEIDALRRCAGASGSGGRRASPRPSTPSPASASLATPAARPARQRWPWLVAAATLLLLLLGLVVLHRPSATSDATHDRPVGSTPGSTAGRSTPPADASPSPAPPAPSSDRYRLQPLRVDDASWVEVRNADGAVLFRGPLQGEQRFAIGAGLRVLAGRPDLVAGGRDGDRLQPLGAIDRVEWLRIEPRNVVRAPAASPPTAPAP